MLSVKLHSFCLWLNMLIPFFVKQLFQYILLGLIVSHYA